jgi:hypothetical protein
MAPTNISNASNIKIYFELTSNQCLANLHRWMQQIARAPPRGKPKMSLKQGNLPIEHMR